MSEKLNELKKFVGEEIVTLYSEQAKVYKNDFINFVGEKIKSIYGIEPIIDVVLPRNPFIDSRVLIVPGNETQKYVALQTFGGGAITTIDVISLPEKMHEGIQKKYVGEILGQMNWYFVAGGHMDFSGRQLKIHSESGDFGNGLAGYDTNSIASHVLNLTGQFENIEVNPGKYNANTGEFFDKWLDLFMRTAVVGGKDEFILEACKIHRDYGSASLSLKYVSELLIRSANKSGDNIFASITDELFKMQGEVFAEAMKNK